MADFGFFPYLIILLVFSILRIRCVCSHKGLHTESERRESASHSFGPESNWKLTPFSCGAFLVFHSLRADSFSLAFYSVSEHLAAFLVCLYSSLFALSGSPLEHACTCVHTHTSLHHWQAESGLSYQPLFFWFVRQQLSCLFLTIQICLGANSSWPCLPIIRNTPQGAWVVLLRYPF